MTLIRVILIETNVANTASVRAALRRVGAAVEAPQSAADVRDAAAVVLPGVGSFGVGMAALAEQRLIDALRFRINAGRPTLAICLGMQLLCRRSDESPGVEGLGVVDAEIEPFPETVIRPQMGWNYVKTPSQSSLIQPGYAYFANRYRLAWAPNGWLCATADYDGRFVAAMQRGDALACQFHPELSGRWGLDLIDRWLVSARRFGATEASPC